MAVAVVTDSAADLPPALAAEHGIEVVPLLVAFGSDTRADGVDLSPPEFWEWARREFPSTAAPPPAAFARAYGRLQDAGATGAVSIHLSGALSSTVRNAAAAAGEAGLPARVVDSRLVGVGLGLVALEAARAARAGASVDQVVHAAEETASRVLLVAALETVEFLRRGGRVGAAKAVLSDLLRIRPVLSMSEGVPVLVSRARTRGRALEEVVGLVAGPAVAAAVAHGDAPDADAVAARVEEACGVRPSVSLMGAVTGAHLGPGAVGVAVLRPAAERGS